MENRLLSLKYEINTILDEYDLRPTIEYKLKAFQDAIIKYSSENNSIPSNLNDLFTNSPKLKNYFNEYPFNEMYYLPSDSINYQIRFPGTDTRPFTSYDIVLNKVVIIK